MTASWAANIDTFRDDRPRPIAVQNFFTNFTIGLRRHQHDHGVRRRADLPVQRPGRGPDRSVAGHDDRRRLPRTRSAAGHHGGLLQPGVPAEPSERRARRCAAGAGGRVSPDCPGIPSPPWYQLWLQQNGDTSYDDIDFDSDEFRYEIPKYFEGYPSKFVDPEQRAGDRLRDPDRESVQRSGSAPGRPARDRGTEPPVDRSTLAQLPSPQINPNNAGGGVCPQTRTAPYFHPTELYLGPTLPEAPRTAIVFGIVPPRGVTPANFHTFRVPYSQFHARWMDFMDLLEPGAFGWEPGDACELQTLVFDASPQTFFRSQPWTSGGGGEIATTALPRLTTVAWGSQTDADGAVSEDATGPWFDDVAPDLEWLERPLDANSDGLVNATDLHNPTRIGSTAPAGVQSARVQRERVEPLQQSEPRLRDRSVGQRLQRW